MSKRDMQDAPVAAVCGSELRIYGPVGPRGIRPLRSVQKMAHRGAALLAASEFDDVSRRDEEARKRAATAKAANQARLVRVVETVLLAA